MAKDKKDVRRLIGVIRDKISSGAMPNGFYTATELAQVVQDVIDDAARLDALTRVRPRSVWAPSDGPVLWWKLPVESPPFLGVPSDDLCLPDFSHWTPLPSPSI
ncbi:hypothetical protein YA0089_26745 [Pseudomonas viridiflava]|uniref:hypothetical protein n=1 Tax=Pseudomonas viridiflava TaxID=33069 RepID=UPI0018E6502A|nr:hypothetical protein [Pseudomonas viridiflava]MBI6727217.1 hypothetical protein [Pseudomonas viridiflava]